MKIPPEIKLVIVGILIMTVGLTWLFLIVNRGA
jgi:hypothetical protein